MIEAIPYLKLLGGLVYLLLGGDILVRGAIGLCRRTQISPVVAGLTIVAAGTSAPELLVSMYAALSGFGGIALGNVIGSNIANVLLVLGVPALIAPIACREGNVRQQSVFMLGVSVIFVLLCSMGTLGPMQGLFLLSLLVVGTLLAVRGHFRMPGMDPDEAREQLAEVLGIPGSGWLIAAFTAVGALMLPLGADLTVDGAVHIARSLDISEAVIGASVIAIGTSLPELSTTVVAAFHRNAAVALGNVVGSNVLNMLGIIGATALVAPIPIEPSLMAYDAWVMLASAAVLTGCVLANAILSRTTGVAMLVAYGLYVAMMFRPT